MPQWKALLLSITVEAVVALAMVRLLQRPNTPKALRVTAQPGSAQVMLTAAAATLLSHPFAWWANTTGLKSALPDFAARASVIEIGVVIVEAALYTWLLRLKPTQGALIALIANAASFGTGLLIWALR